jgi:hypothetical protein
VPFRKKYSRTHSIESKGRILLTSDSNQSETWEEHFKEILNTDISEDILGTTEENYGTNSRITRPNIATCDMMVVVVVVMMMMTTTTMMVILIKNIWKTALRSKPKKKEKYEMKLLNWSSAKSGNSTLWMPYAPLRSYKNSDNIIANLQISSFCSYENEDCALLGYDNM